jgi:predicted lipid-binding transport protein (Tim44 family)
MVGWGRVGAIIGPMLGGLLIGAKLDRVTTFTIFASLAVVPVLTMFLAARARSAIVRTPDRAEVQ